jgi:hypothetical protein
MDTSFLQVRFHSVSLALVCWCVFLTFCFVSIPCTIEPTGRQLVTLFSAPNYCGEFDNAGGMISVDENLMCSFQILKPSARSARFARNKLDDAQKEQAASKPNTASNSS